MIGPLGRHVATLSHQVQMVLSKLLAAQNLLDQAHHQDLLSKA